MLWALPPQGRGHRRLYVRDQCVSIAAAGAVPVSCHRCIDMPCSTRDHREAERTTPQTIRSHLAFGMGAGLMWFGVRD